MTAPTGLGQYNKPQGSQGDRIQAQQMVDRPILVWVRKLQHLNRTKYSAEGGDAIYIDFIDLQSNQVYIEVMWMAGAIVDGLKQYAGDGNAYPIKVVKVQGGQWGSYQTIESLSEDPQWMNHVMANLPIFQQMVAQTRAQKEAEWAVAMQQANQPPQVPGGPPVPTVLPAQYAANPQAGLHDQAMALQPPHVQQALQQAAPPPQPQYQQQAPAVAAPQQFQQAPPQQQFQQPAAQVPAGPPPQYQQQAPQLQQAAAPSAQPGYQQQPQQQFAAAPPQQAPAAVAPPQYQQPAAPVGPPGPSAPPQQFQQAGPPPAQQYAAPGPPPPPLGAVTGQTVEQLTAALNQIG